MCRTFLPLVLMGLWPSWSAAADTGSLLARIKAVQTEGAGNVEAARAWRELVQIGPAALEDVLSALDDAGPIAANWLRSAVDAIAERELRAGRTLPKDRLEAFILDSSHSGPARRLAFEWLSRVDATAPDRLIPGMLYDPGAELRRDAVARLIAEGEQHLAKENKPAAAAAFGKAMSGARDRDQVLLLADHLRNLGIHLDLAAQLGFIRQWMLIGPFEHAGGIGFRAVYPPEQTIDLSATYVGKGGKPVAWREHITLDPLGVVDLNKALTKHMGAVAYAYAVVTSPEERPVEVRVGSNNAVKIFLNGKPIFAHEEYHHGNRTDQYVGRGKLLAGRNEVLLKVCQNEQKEDWAQSWSFQLRLCDAIGGAVPFRVTTDRAAEPTGGKR
jgi:hypothetical protein